MDKILQKGLLRNFEGMGRSNLEKKNQIIAFCYNEIFQKRIKYFQVFELCRRYRLRILLRLSSHWKKSNLKAKTKIFEKYKKTNQKILLYNSASKRSLKMISRGK